MKQDTGTTEAERAILEDIRRRTGIVAPKLGWFDTTKHENAIKTILPILAEWIGKSDAGIRGTIYSLFAAPYARDWIDLLISHWPTSEEPLDRSTLVSALCATVQDIDAGRIFRLMVNDPERLEDFRLLAKLSEFPSVERSVRDYIVKALEEREFRAGDLADMAKVRDPRIAEQLRKRAQSDDPAVRMVVSRFSAKAGKLPSGVRRMSVAPNSGSELFSTEVDIDELEQLLRDVARRFSLNISSSPFRRARNIMLAASLDTWLATELEDEAGQAISLWLRLEDIDTVELVVASGALTTDE